MGCHSLESLRTGVREGAWDRLRGLTWDKLSLPIAPLFAISWGPLEFRRYTPVGKKRGGVTGGHAPRRESTLVIFYE